MRPRPAVTSQSMDCCARRDSATSTSACSTCAIRAIRSPIARASSATAPLRCTRDRCASEPGAAHAALRSSRLHGAMAAPRDARYSLHSQGNAKEFVTLAQQLGPGARVVEVVIEIVPGHELALATGSPEPLTHTLRLLDVHVPVESAVE